MNTAAHQTQFTFHQDQPQNSAELQIANLMPSLGSSGLCVRVLHTEEDRHAIVDLRKLSAFGVEKDLQLGLAPLEKERDAIGLVTAVYRDRRAIATIRFVPTGYGMTAAERLKSSFGVGTQTFGPHSWEVGRIVMAPEDRDPALLPYCLGMALSEFLKWESPVHFHSSTTLQMARLWRRFGMKTTAVVQGESGKRYALVEGLVKDVAGFLQMPCSQTEERVESQDSMSAQWIPSMGSSVGWWPHAGTNTVHGVARGA